MRKLIYLFSLPVMLLAVSCTKQIPDYGATSTVKMANGWWVTLYRAGVPEAGPVFFNTYNTSSNTDSLWVDAMYNFDANNHFQPDSVSFRCKAVVDLTNLTFSVTNADNDDYDGSSSYPATVTLSNGKILPKAGHSKTGNITDSIYMQATFPNVPGVTFTIAGTARTGIEKDDY